MMLKLAIQEASQNPGFGVTFMDATKKWKTVYSPEVIEEYEGEVLSIKGKDRGETTIFLKVEGGVTLVKVIDPAKTVKKPSSMRRGRVSNRFL